MKLKFSSMACVLLLGNLLLATEPANQGIETKARDAAKKMAALPVKSGLTRNQLYKIAHFIETELPEWLPYYGNYLSRKFTHLPRSLEYDPETGYIYIHLRLHGVQQRLGKGSKKLVTTSILYDAEHPQMVAHCQTEVPLEQEIETIRALRSIDGIVDVKSILKRRSRGRTPVYSFMCALYEEGSLSHVMKTKKFSFSEKLEIARDCLFAMANMHSRGYVHRDVCGANFLVSRVRRKNGRGKKYSVVISDLGRAMSARAAVGSSVQGHKFFTSPEGVYKKDLTEMSYIYADLYALGCVLYQLFYEKEAPWVSFETIKNRALSKKIRKEKLVPLLKAYHEKESAHLQAKNPQDPRVAIKQLIMRLVHPEPEMRGSALEGHAEIAKIMKSYETGEPLSLQ